MSDKRSNTRPYRDRDGKPITLFQLVRSDPDWAASTISHYENLNISVKGLEAERDKLQEALDSVGQASKRISSHHMAKLFDKDGKYIALEGGK